jgi:competence protein ComEC
MFMKRKLLLIQLLLAAIVLAAQGLIQVRSAPTLGNRPASSMTTAPASLQVYVMDVGRGQSVLIVSPVGKAVLIDAGPAEAGGRVVSELRRRGVQNLEFVVATQTGADYIGGLRRVASSSDLSIKNFIDSAQPWKTDAYQQLMAVVKSAGTPVLNARRGQFFSLGGGARFDILNPAGDGTWLESANAVGVRRENANGVVVRLLYRDFVMLIMGGAGSETAERMLAAGQNIWAPFLLIGDGGSSASTSEKMLSVVQPRYAIISAGGQGVAPETIERLKNAKAEIYRTDTGGEIYITSDGKKHEISAERKSAP